MSFLFLPALLRTSTHRCAPLLIGAALISSCQTGANSTGNAQALIDLQKEPLATQPWTFAQQPGTLIQTNRYRIYTTINDSLFQHLLAKVLEATHDRVERFNANAVVPPPNSFLDCFVFNSRSQWETYTRARGGSNATLYLHITAGGYCQEGVFAGYDIGRERTLSVVAHEAWHQYSWYAFKDHLPSWLEEGLATQNEKMEFDGTRPIFKPELNWNRFSALQKALRENYLWKIEDLVKAHAGQAITMQQRNVDAYYSQLWSLVLFLERSPKYQPKLRAMLADASSGKMSAALTNSGLSRGEIDHFTERWNTAAGPIYLKKYINPDVGQLESEYLAYVKQLTASWPPRVEVK